MESVINFLVIGAGPAGMSAAIEIAKAGEKVTLLEDALTIGGPVYRRNLKISKKDHNPGREKIRANQLFEELAKYSQYIQVIESATVLGIWNNKEVLYTVDGRSEIIYPKQIIIANGAFERPMPFPGWTLPGVVNAGGIKTFINTMQVRPGFRAIVSGTGPMLINVANRIHETGVEVIAVLDAGNPEMYSPQFLEKNKAFAFAQSIAEDLNELHQNGIPLLLNHSIFEAQGQVEVTGILYGPVDPISWKPIKEKAIFDDADLVVLGFGYIPDNAFSILANCQQVYRDGLGWCVVRDSFMQTTVPGILAVGDCADIGGMYIAEWEGKIAGIKALENLGLIDSDLSAARMSHPLEELKNLQDYREVLISTLSVKNGIWDLLQDNTLVCRCEEVSLSALKNAVDKGAKDLQAVKLYTRLGMGPCQGRNCAPTASMYMCHQYDISPTEVGRINPRPPVRSVTLGALAGIANPQK